MTFTYHFPKHTSRKNFKRSDIEEMNRKNRELQEIQEQYDNARREALNKNRKYVQ